MFVRSQYFYPFSVWCSTYHPTIGSNNPIFLYAQCRMPQSVGFLVSLLCTGAKPEPSLVFVKNAFQHPSLMLFRPDWWNCCGSCVQLSEVWGSVEMVFGCLRWPGPQRLPWGELQKCDKRFLLESVPAVDAVNCTPDSKYGLLMLLHCDCANIYSLLKCFCRACEMEQNRDALRKTSSDCRAICNCFSMSAAHRKSWHPDEREHCSVFKTLFCFIQSVIKSTLKYY